MKDAIWIVSRRIRRAGLVPLTRLSILVASLVAGCINRSPIAHWRHHWQNRYPLTLIQAASLKPLVQKWSQLSLVVRWTAIATAFLVALPLISLVHEIAVLLAALLLNWASMSPVLEWPMRAIVRDPIYAGVALYMVGNIEAQGLAVSGLIGDFLHNLWPTLFVDPSLAVDGSWVSAVADSGSSVISQFLVAASADGFLVLLGVLLVKWGLRGVSPLRALVSPSILNGRVLFGVLLQTHGVLSVMSIEITEASLEHSGLAQIGTKLLVTSHESYESSMLALGGWLPFGLHLLAVVVVYIAALVFARLVSVLLRMTILNQAIAGSQGISSAPNATRLLYLLPVVGIAVIASSSLGIAATNFDYYDELATPDSTTASGVEATPKDGATIESPEGDSAAISPPGPSVVSITGRSHNYVYLVNGKRKSIRGMGYNVIYRKLSDERRANRYERDFARMRDAGINTILGWDFDQGYAHDTFDELLLSKARKSGLGVLMPYFLDPNGEYSNSAYRTRLANDVVAWVRRFKANPAVRMWAIGNEVMHGMEAMKILRGATPKSNPAAFVDFYIKLADAVHKEDPNHPVIYREAEDGFFGPFKAVRPKGVETRPWLVFGMNIFSARLSSILTDWESQGFDNPLLVSEFGPVGLSPEDRSRGLVKMWQTIRSHKCGVIGGIVYVWTTAGPEPVDQAFGLLDGDGNAVDGSLDAIANEFRQDSRLPRNCAPSSPGRGMVHGQE